MNYEIIKDEEALKNFITWLPDLERHEKFYLSLFARKKYCQKLIKSNDKTQLKRFLATKENMFDKIKQLECEIGSYKIKDQVAPQESLVLYINVNPRDMEKATYGLLKKCVDLIETGSNYNIHAEALSCIQRSKSNTTYVDFDIDNREVNWKKVKDILIKDSFRVVETRGGYHILVSPELNKGNKTWYPKLQSAVDADEVGDQLTPVVGCTQGGFTPKFIKV